LDPIDAAIIGFLQQDGRMAAADMAEHLPGVSPGVVRYRINRLQEAGAISIVAIVHPKPLGFVVMADVLVETEPSRTPQVLDELARLELVRYVAYTGDRDISIQIVTRTVQELYSYVYDAVQSLPGVTRTRTYLLPDTRKFTYDWHVPGQVISGAAASAPATEARSTVPHLVKGGPEGHNGETGRGSVFPQEAAPRFHGPVPGAPDDTAAVVGQVTKLRRRMP
jgi:Lrp/AsnC family transcriptional regulator for asnA, asnC and gidA